MKWLFIVFCVYLLSLFFREQYIPGDWVVSLTERWLPDNLVLHLDSFSFGFRSGLHARGVKIYDRSVKNPLVAKITAISVDCDILHRRLRLEGVGYPKLGDGYYHGGTHDRNERVEVRLPDLGKFRLTLVDSNILGVEPRLVTCDVEVSESRVDVRQIRLVWPDRDFHDELSGFCYVDFDRQEVYGEVDGLAKQSNIRPLMVALDVPIANVYIDAFTDVPVPCRSWCAWKVDLMRSDFDLWLDLKPDLGKYNGVPMRHADGKIHLHNYTRDNVFNYHTEVGPIVATDRLGRLLDGKVDIVSTNGQNTVTVVAKSAQPICDVLRIGGFTGDYVGDEVVGDSEFQLEFRFPRNGPEGTADLNGKGHIEIRNGQLMRMRGFKGLIEAMPSMAPAVTWFTDTTQATADYVIENGVVKTDGIYIEGSLFSIKMYGALDSVKNTLDFTVRVQFAKKDSLMGKLLHPLTWPFTKLLLEFRLTGTPEKPVWKYVSVVDRVWETVK